MNNKVVARLQDGRVIKGTSLDVDPAKPTFHVKPAQGQTVQVELSDLKALFFVRSLDGDATRVDRQQLDADDVRAKGSTVVRVRFKDGEALVGLTIRYPPNRPFFYIVPADPASNNIRILVNKDAVESLEPLPSS